MENQPDIRRVILAIEGDELEAGARTFCEELLPGSAIEMYSLDTFAQSLEMDGESNEFRVLMLHADEDGHLDNGSPIVQSIISSRAPVLVTRQMPGGSVPSAEIRRVVVPLDGSASAGQAIPVASRAAQVKNVPVRFLMVIDPSRVIPPAYAYDPDAWGMIEELRQTSHWALSQAEAEMRRNGVEAGSDLMFGPINASLAASIGEGDLVVMASHSSTWKRPRDRESVAMRTLVSVPQPMLIMQAQTEAPIIVDGYQACSWVEPLQRGTTRIA